MRRRLLAVLIVLMGAAVFLLSLPLANASARGRTEHLLLERRFEAVRFADLADLVRTAADRSELAAEIGRYAELYGADVLIVDTAGHTVAHAGTGAAAVAASKAMDARSQALTGRPTAKLPTIRPWGPSVVVLAEPVGRDERVSGAVILAVPTGAARRDVAFSWALIAAGALAAFTAAALVAAGITRWLIRPVRDLDRAVEGLGAGSLEARAVSETGPPELRSLRSHFNTMAEAVTDSINRQRDFVADASHQLRNPLATLVLQLENVEPHLGPGAGRAEHSRALDEAERLGELLDGLLTLARVESGTAELTDQDVSAAARERVSAWKPVFHASGLELTADIRDNLRARALADAAGRVLDALLDNAAKFVPSGGCVEVHATLRGQTVVVRVADNGPGVVADQLPTLLRRFVRSTQHQNVPGSGLGLAIADEIARISGGRLATSHNTPRGLVVELQLPAQKTDR
ncbi:signal transduction histidine kinase [Streptomyces sp. SLBN-118]|uniref:sensor histidine kinase n=1 Tax=Streptomyces sp. SLBN-118 TaxID=2768454 RepID=UPI00114F7676|nr:HAMP domain-containing sensor histidine kinase [Streptomyces sp. SLBN-118]TQK50071.1 signal transduction histidine kinase [Streptomyces sp. SLBN-118]